jgi:hypothetical protein
MSLVALPLISTAPHAMFPQNLFSVLPDQREWQWLMPIR